MSRDAVTVLNAGAFCFQSSENPDREIGRVPVDLRSLGQVPTTVLACAAKAAKTGNQGTFLRLHEICGRITRRHVTKKCSCDAHPLQYPIAPSPSNLAYRAANQCTLLDCNVQQSRTMSRAMNRITNCRDLCPTPIPLRKETTAKYPQPSSVATVPHVKLPPGFSEAS